MMRHIWTVFCREVVIDAETNSASLLHILDELDVTMDANTEQQEINTARGKAVLMSLWARRAWDEPVTSQAKIQLLAPDGSTLVDNTVLVDLSENRLSRLKGNLVGLPVTTTGWYEWAIMRQEDQIEGGWVEEARIPIHIKVSEVTP